MVNLSLTLLLLLHILLLSNLKFTAWPEMLSYPYLMSKDFLPYKDFVIPYTPFLVMVLSFVYKIFGFSVEILRSFTWVMILINDILIFLILKQISNKLFLNIFFIAAYIVLSSFLDGNMLWVDSATVIPLLLSIYFSIDWIKQRKQLNLFLTTFFLGITILTKQIGLLYAFAFLFFCIIQRKFQVREIIVGIGGILAVLLPFLYYLLQKNIFTDFFNWTLYYPLKYWKEFPDYVDFQITKIESLVLFFIVSIIFWSVLNFKFVLRNKEFLFVTVTLVAALIAVYPRFSFFHLQPALALTVILAAIITKNLTAKLRNWLMMYVFLATIIIVVLLKDQIFGQEIRFYSLDDRKLSMDIERVLNVDDKTYFLGLNSSQYVFTKTIPPKPWIEGFLWYMESPGAQNHFIEGLENEKPNFIFVKKPVRGNWFGLETYQPKEVINYIFNNYSVSEIINGDIEVWKRKKE